MKFISIKMHKSWERKFAWLPVTFRNEQETITVWLESYGVRELDNGSLQVAFKNGRVINDIEGMNHD